MEENKMVNPFTLDFGREPNELIPRLTVMNELIHAFLSENPSQHISLITGVRGCGKTVFMTSVSKRICEEKDWISVELSPEQDMLASLVAKLGHEKTLFRIFQRLQINLSLFGVGVKVSGSEPVSHAEVALDHMLDGMKRHHKKLLITVDEAVNNQNVRMFASAFQILLRKDYPIFLLMTGLYDNIRSLQDQKTLTFLYRAPRITLQPLNIIIMADCYQRIFQLPREDAVQMARETRGYSFAFQVLGYFTWQHSLDPTHVKSLYKQYLVEYVYEKIWADLSPVDRRVAMAIAQIPDGKVLEIRKLLGMETNQFNPYRIRLIRKGIVDGETYGQLKFTLPLFEEFVLESGSMI